MVDNRSAGVLGIGGGINFKSGDISGTAAKTSDDRASQGTEYFMQDGEEQSEQNPAFVDRSMQLRASLNSLALLNVVSVLQNKRKIVLLDDDFYGDKLSSSNRVEKVDEQNKNNQRKDKEEEKKEETQNQDKDE